MIRCFVLYVSFAAFGNLALAESYICVADAASGFHFDGRSQEWQRTTFKVDDIKYVVNRWNPRGATRLLKTAWEVRRLGSQQALPEYSCSSDFDSRDELLCDNGFRDGAAFRMNRRALRFVSTHTAGYAWQGRIFERDVPGDFNDLAIELGKCSAI